MREHRRGVAHHQVAVDRSNHAHEAIAFGAAGGHLRGIERRKRAGAVIEVRHRHDVAGIREPLRHHVEVGADAERIHVENHRRPWSGAGGLEDVAVEHAVGVSRSIRCRGISHVLVAQSVSSTLRCLSTRFLAQSARDAGPIVVARPAAPTVSIVTTALQDAREGRRSSDSITSIEGCLLGSCATNSSRLWRADPRHRARQEPSFRSPARSAIRQWLTRRLVAAGVAADHHCLVYYERGGRLDLRWCAVSLDRRRRLTRGGATAAGARTIDDVRNAVVSGAVGRTRSGSEVWSVRRREPAGRTGACGATSSAWSAAAAAAAAGPAFAAVVVMLYPERVRTAVSRRARRPTALLTRDAGLQIDPAESLPSSRWRSTISSMPPMGREGGERELLARAEHFARRAGASPFGPQVFDRAAVAVPFQNRDLVAATGSIAPSPRPRPGGRRRTPAGRRRRPLARLGGVPLRAAGSHSSRRRTGATTGTTSGNVGFRDGRFSRPAT